VRAERRAKNRQLVRVLLLLVAAAHSQTPQTISLPSDSTRWDLLAEAKVTDYLGRKAIFLDGGAAVVKDLEMRDGVIDVDVATPASRGSLASSFTMTTAASPPAIWPRSL
jgi:hypothetical protein